MSFVVYDLILLVVFTLAVVLFLYTKRANLKREGLIYLYRTSIGLKLIDWFGEKHKNWLKPLQYVVIASGYALMASIVYLLAKLSYTYITSPYIAKALKVPVIFPLIPYLPQIFKIDFLPPFYFTYWIIIIAIIAVPHEFAHGIFAKLNKIRIKSTGFGFLGPFLAAFVEQDDNQMQKAPKFAQLSILAAGTFANVLTAILFGLLLWGFFAGTFAPAGVNFSSYATSAVNVSNIDFINGVPLGIFNLSMINSNQTLINFTADNLTYYTTGDAIRQTLVDNSSILIGYDDSPAFDAKLSGAIHIFDGEKINSYPQLKEAILAHKPGDMIEVDTNSPSGNNSYEIKLGNKDGKAFLGIGVVPVQSSGVSGWLYSLLSKIKDPYVYYISTWGEFGIFIYNLLWWIVIICISVALTNMLPMGMFDGGKFFMLTVWGITGSKKAGERAFKWATWIILILVAALMVKWIFTLF